MANEFILENLSSGIGLSTPELEKVRKNKGFELYRKEKMNHLVNWIYVFRAWSSLMNRFVYIHNYWDYYKEVISACRIFFDGTDCPRNDRHLNDEFIAKYILGKYPNVGRPSEMWEVEGKLYRCGEPALDSALDKMMRNGGSYKIYDPAGDYYRLNNGDYVHYDFNRDNEIGALTMEKEKSYRINMLSKYEKQKAWYEEEHKDYETMIFSPKYRR